MTAGEVRRLLADGAVIVDVRPVADVAAGHIPGAIAIALRAQFVTWLGWLVSPQVPVVIVRNHDQDPADILWPALNVGFDRLAGELMTTASAAPRLGLAVNAAQFTLLIVVIALVGGVLGSERTVLPLLADRECSR